MEASMIDRRGFLQLGTAAAVACAAGLPRTANAQPFGWPVGFQGFDARLVINDDWDTGWRTMQQIGFKSVDLVSFHGYGYQAAAAAKTPEQVRDTLQSVGMIAENCQFSYKELAAEFDDRMAFARVLNLKYIICAPDSTHTKTADDWKTQGDELNALAAKVQSAGFHLGYHNHDLEFLDVDGQTPYDILMAHTDPALVKFQIDVGNLTFAGKDCYSYLAKYPDRYFSMHAKDYLPGKTSVPVGQGTLDWPKIFSLVKKTTIQNYYAEVAAYGIGSLRGTPASSWPTDSTDQLRQSYVYLHGLGIS
jgi:sugar phosphate isomerase/epimerase